MHKLPAKPLRTLIASSACLAALLASSSASASGFSTARFGGEHGHPTTNNPTAIYYNPAGLAVDTPGESDEGFRFKLFVDGTFALRAASFNHTASPNDTPEPDGAAGANTGEASLFNFAGAPMVGAAALIDDLAIGAGFYVPFGGASSWGKNDAFEGSTQFAGPVDGVQRWHTIDGNLRSMYLSLGAAYDIMDRIAVGATFNLVMSQVQTVRARTVAGVDDVNLEGRSLIDVSGMNASFGVGAIGEVVEDKLWIGFSYQAPPGLGEQRLNGTLTNNYSGNITEDPVDLLQTLPAVYRLGVRARPVPDVELRIFGDVTDWSTFERQCVVPEGGDCEIADDGSFIGEGEVPYLNLVRDWGTGFAIRAGGSYFLNDAVELYAGAGYDSNVVPDTTLEPALTDFHDVSASLGGRFQIADEFAFSATYTHIFYFSRDTNGESVLATLESPSKSPDAGGEYTQTIGVLNAYVELMF
jgi:long-chain fatty acid transport protein